MANEFEQRFLNFVYTTDTPITPGAVAYSVGCSIDEAGAHLERLVHSGVLKLELTDDGELRYEYPGRTRLAPPAARVPSIAVERSQRTARPPGAPVGVHGTPPPQPIMQVGGAAALPQPAPSAPAATPSSQGDKACYYCGETILAVAKKCKHCGEMLDAAHRQAPVQVNVGMQQLAAPQPTYVANHLNPGVAGLLSFLWPGAGQMYTGRIGAGLAWMFGVFLGYLALAIPGLILHIVCIFSAAGDARNANAGGQAPQLR